MISNASKEIPITSLISSILIIYSTSVIQVMQPFSIFGDVELLPPNCMGIIITFPLVRSASVHDIKLNHSLLCFCFPRIPKEKEEFIKSSIYFKIIIFLFIAEDQFHKAIIKTESVSRNWIHFITKISNKSFRNYHFLYLFHRYLFHRVILNTLCLDIHAEYSEIVLLLESFSCPLLSSSI